LVLMLFGSPHVRPYAQYACPFMADARRTGYKSPQVDMGYDISDYRQIHEPYGTLEEIEKLIAELKKHGIRLLMDLVINHTSEQHAWFLESKSSLNNPKRDWYIWRKGKTGPNGEKLPPNNWESLFKGHAWAYDETTDEWYFHIFASAQPDLNWENPEVRAAVDADIHFWLEKGVAGFRMDAINLISKPMDFPDAPAGQGAFETCCDQVYNRPQVHEWLHDMKVNVMDQYDDLVNIGECAGTNEVEEIQRYISPERKELDMIFQFGVACIDFGPWGVFSRRDWDLAELKNTTKLWQNALRPSWNTWHIENHDSEYNLSCGRMDMLTKIRWSLGEPLRPYVLARVLPSSVKASCFLHDDRWRHNLSAPGTRDRRTEPYRRCLFA
jgi:oligo-1,6-glucosidase